MKRIIRQAFWKYLVVFSVPIIILVGMFLYSDSNITRKATSDTQLNLLSEFSNEIETVLSKLENTVLNMSGNEEIVNVQALADNEKCDLIQIYDDSLPDGISLLYFFRRTNYVYFHEDIITYHAFETSNYFDPALNYAGFFSQLNQIGSPRILPIDRKDQREEIYSAAFLAPVPVMASSPSGSVAFLIQRSYFDRLSEKYFGTTDICLHVLDATHNILYSNNHLVEPAELSKIIREKPLGASEYTVNGTSYMLMREVSPSQGLFYITFIPKGEFFRESQSNVAVLLLLTMVLLFLSTLTALSINKNLYSNIDRMEAAQNQVASELVNRNQLITQMALNRLLDGTVRDTNAESCKQAGLDFAYQHFFVLTCVFDKLELLQEELDSILSAFSAATKKGIAFYAVRRENQITVIVNTLTQNDTRQAISETAYHILREQLECDFTLGCGAIQDRPDDIKKSYIEALASIDVKSNSVADNCYIFENGAPETAHFACPYAEQALIEQSIRSGSADIAISVIRTALEKIDKVPSTAVRRCLYYDMINMIIKIAAALNIPLGQHEISKIALWNDFSAIRQEIEYTAINLTQSIQTEKAENLLPIKRSLVEYVQANFTDNSLSLGRLAEEFGLSYAYVSKTFKVETGQSFLSYITQLRITYVKEKLKATDTPIKDIVLESGYLDVANFMRKFKQVEGITPGQYRQLHKS